MFETRPPKPDSAASLQAVSWADLSARLAAARDFRKALGEDDSSEGSFDAASARWIADHTPGHEPDEGGSDRGRGKPDVNPDRLANLKTVDCMAGAERALPTLSARLGDRGK